MQRSSGTPGTSPLSSANMAVPAESSVRVSCASGWGSGSGVGSGVGAGSSEVGVGSAGFDGVGRAGSAGR